MDKSLQKNLVWGAVALGGVYLLYKLLTGSLSSAAKATGAALTSAGEAVGSGLYDLLHANYNPGTYLRVVFEDGSVHAVLSDLVRQDGSFVAPATVGAPWAGQTLTMIQNKGDGTFYALSNG